VKTGHHECSSSKLCTAAPGTTWTKNIHVGVGGVNSTLSQMCLDCHLLNSHCTTRRDAMRDFCWLGTSNAALHYPTLHYVMLHYITLRRLAPHHTHPFNGPLSRTTRVSRYHRGKTNLNFTEVSWTCPDMWAYGGVHSMLSDLSWRRVWSLLELSQLSMCTD